MVVDVPFPVDNLHFSVWIRIMVAVGASEKVCLDDLFWQGAAVCEWNVPGCSILRQNCAGNVPAAVPWETSVGLGWSFVHLPPHRAVWLLKQRCGWLGNKSRPLCPNGCGMAEGCPLESKGGNGIFLTGTGIGAADSTGLAGFQLPVVSVGTTDPPDWNCSPLQLEKPFHLSWSVFVLADTENSVLAGASPN